jgi:RimK family alpha-L-glutamate ligase
MRIGVLGAADSWYLHDLQRAAGARHEVMPVAFTRMAGGIGRGRAWSVAQSGQESFSSFDALLVRAMPPGSLEQVVFRMDLLGRWEEAGGVVVNPARAIEAAVDKYLALARLAQAGLDVPHTLVCQTAEEAMEAFHLLGKNVVLKPLFGAEGRGLTRLEDEDLALRAFTMLEQLGAVLYLQEFVPHPGHDIRLFVSGSQVLAMKRRNPADWRTNVSRGARVERHRPSATEVEIGCRAARAVGASLVGVDLLPARDGRQLVLEVNAAPGWRGLARALQLDVSSIVLRHLQHQVENRSPFPATL